MAKVNAQSEVTRMEDDRLGKTPWKRWGPYLSERQWGTVREDYSEGGNAWDYFTHDHSRSRAYHWGEDGLAGLRDRCLQCRWNCDVTQVDSYRYEVDSRT